MTCTDATHPTTGVAYPWIVTATAMVNHFYFYAVDDDFGPFFLKFCSYFPYTARLCINGNEYAKRQAIKAGMGFTPLVSRNGGSLYTSLSNTCWSALDRHPAGV
jgi:hypothetical protein